MDWYHYVLTDSMNAKKRKRTIVQVNEQILSHLTKNRIHPREPYYDVLMRLLGLTGREEKQTQTKEAGAREVSASSNSEGSA